MLSENCNILYQQITLYMLLILLCAKPISSFCLTYTTYRGILLAEGKQPLITSFEENKMARIIIVDDMGWVAKIMAAHLQTLGHETAVIEEFYDVPLETVVQKIMEFKPDLLALDHYLFGSSSSPYSGTDVYEEVMKQMSFRPKVLGLGSTSGTQPYASMLSHCSKHDIEKDWSMERFVESVDRILAK